MKYYIATSLSRAASHNLVRDALETFGYKISYDWTLYGNLRLVSKERLQEVSVYELNGISESEFVIVLLPGGKGTHVEIGFAIASGKKIFFHSEDPTLFELGPQTIPFYHHPDVTRLSCSLNNIAFEVHSFFASSVSNNFDCN